MEEYLGHGFLTSFRVLGHLVLVELKSRIEALLLLFVCASDVKSEKDINFPSFLVPKVFYSQSLAGQISLIFCLLSTKN